MTQIEYLIIGAGPAGLQLAYFLEKAQRSYLILERGKSVGTFFRKFPRHRKLISINKVYTGYDDPEVNLRWDWNSLISHDPSLRLSKYSQEYFPETNTLTDYLEDYANQFELKIQFETEVAHVTKESGEFRVTDQHNRCYCSQRLVIATGLSQPYTPNIPGIDLAENYTTVSTEPHDFVNQRVLIIGKGNSSFETADHLISAASLIHVVSPTPIKMAWRTKYVGHLRAVNNNFLDTYQLKSQNGILDAEIIQIQRFGNEFHVSFNYAHANGEQETIVYDRVIVCTGFQFDSTLFDPSCKPLLTIHDRFPAQTSEWESVNVSGLYFAGVLMHMRDFKKKQSGFIHGFRHNIQALHHILEHKYHQTPFPSCSMPATPKALTTSILDRVNRSAGLWQQTGFLCDLIVVDSSKQIATYYNDLPRDYIHSSTLGQADHYYIVTLEFGDDVAQISDPFSINRVHKEDADHADDSAFIHPIVRHYHQNRLVAEHHIIEDLEAEWCEPVHIKPLIAFIESQVSAQEIALPPQLRSSLSQSTSAQNSVFPSRLVNSLEQSNCAPTSSLNPQRRRIGEYLIDAGLIKEAQLSYALAEQKKVNLRVGEIIVQHGWLNQQTIDFFVGELCELAS